MAIVELRWVLSRLVPPSASVSIVLTPQITAPIFLNSLAVRSNELVFLYKIKASGFFISTVSKSVGEITLLL